MFIPHLVTDDSITLVIDKQTKVYGLGHPNYSKIIEALKAGDFDEIIRLTNIAEQLNHFGEGKVVVRGGVVYYGEYPVDNSLTRRILKMKDDGFDIGPMVAFLENLMLNPSSRSVNELYGFLSANNLPLTEDGHFLAYKRVRDDWKDYYTGTIDNSLGKVVEMKRNMVNDDKEQTCSYGLHFCSLEYLQHYYGGTGRIVIVKINPRDVVSIPVDYNNSKGRCCRYEVIDTHTSQNVERFDKSVYSNTGQTYVKPVTNSCGDNCKCSSDVFTFDDHAFDEFEFDEFEFDDTECCGNGCGDCTNHTSSNMHPLEAKTVKAQAQAQTTVSPIVSKPTDYLTSEEACAKLGITMNALRKRLVRRSSVVPVTFDGKSYVRIK